MNKEYVTLEIVSDSISFYKKYIDKYKKNMDRVV